MTDTINPKALRQFREARRLTQQQLAQSCGCAKDTVSRWERGQSSNVRARLRERLCKALGVSWEDLLRPPEKVAQSRDDLVQITARVRPESRNALQIVCERYKVDQRIVLEYAPLLFLIAAEKSLEARKEAFESIEFKITKAYDSIEELAPYMGSYIPHADVGFALEEEEESITNRDISRKHTFVHDETNFDPFVYYLQREASNLPDGAVVSIEPSIAGYANYEIAIDTVNDLLKLDPSIDSIASNKVRSAVALGIVDLRTAVSQRAMLSSAEFQQWLDDTWNDSETESERSVREALDSIDFGVVDKEDILREFQD